MNEEVLQMTELRFVLAGEAEAAERATAAPEAVLGGASSGLRRMPVATLPEPVRRTVDPIALAALILAVPGAIVAALDLADRIRGKRKQAQDLIETAQRLRIEHRVEVHVLIADSSRPALAELTADRLLDIARTAAQAPSMPVKSDTA